jgi:hypothetical protein
VNAIQIEEVVILELVEQIAELQVGGTFAKDHVVDIPVELVIVR